MKEHTGGNFWIPEKEGEKIAGLVLGVNEGDYGKQWLIGTFSDEEILTPSHKVLQSRMATVEKGKYVCIEYTGTEAPKLKGHNPTSMYRVFEGGKEEIEKLLS